jgi:hypothetical protein
VGKWTAECSGDSTVSPASVFTSNEESRHAPTRSYDGKCVIYSETNVLEELDEEIAVGLAPDEGRDIPKDI